MLFLGWLGWFILFVCLLAKWARLAARRRVEEALLLAKRYPLPSDFKNGYAGEHYGPMPEWLKK